MTKEEIIISRFGECRCDPIYKNRNRIDPDCFLCEHSEEVSDMMQAFSDQSNSELNNTLKTERKRSEELLSDILRSHTECIDEKNKLQAENEALRKEVGELTALRHRCLVLDAELSRIKGEYAAQNRDIHRLPSDGQKLYCTEIKAISPHDKEMYSYAGPHVPGISFKDAQDYCENNGLGYCKVTGVLIAEIPCKPGTYEADFDKQVDYDTDQN